MGHHLTWVLVFMAVLLPVVYTYVLYPLLLELIFLFRGKKRAYTNDFNGTSPEVHVVMAVHNEEAVLQAKLDALAALDYPPEKLHVWIGSDASTDTTVALLKNRLGNNLHVHIFIFETRRGKAAVVNDLVEAAKADASAGAILLLTDADIIFSQDLLQAVVPHFADQMTGLVDTIILQKREQVFPDHESRYWQWENRIKWLEGALWGSTMGASGGCYAMRMELYRAVPDNFIVDDFFLSMLVLEQGYTVIVEENAFSYAFSPAEAEEEFRRKRRIAAGNWQNFKYYAGFFKRSFFPAGFCFYSHKWLRWMTPFLLLVAWSVVFLWYLLGPGCPWWLLVILLLSIATPLTALVLRRLPLQGKWLFGWVYFIWMQYAMAMGTLDYLKGIRSNVWEPTKRIS